MLALDPVRARALLHSLAEQVDRLAATGRRPVVVCSSRVRRHLRRLVEQAFPQLAVVSHNEIVARRQGRVGRAGERMSRPGLWIVCCTSVTVPGTGHVRNGSPASGPFVRGEGPRHTFVTVPGTGHVWTGHGREGT